MVQGLEQLFRRRDLRTNDGFLSRIIELNDFLDSVVRRDSWYERALVLAEAGNPFAGELGQKQKQIITEQLQQILNQIRYAQKLYEKEKADGDWAEKWQKWLVEPVTRYVEFLKAGEWDKFAKELRNFQRPQKYSYKPRGLDGPIADVIKRTAEDAKGQFEKLFELAIINPDYLDMVGAVSSLQTKVLIELVRRFSRLYGQAKRVINCLDFADLEHYALRLLIDENSPEEGPLPSETALALRDRYKYIFVDEYQDINPVQQAILEMLSGEKNVFVVGDVKQSIYFWRGAEPEIFLERVKGASVEPADTKSGLRVDLNANFRSSKGILDFVNRVFGRIMRADFARIDYDESAKLWPALEKDVAGDKKPAVEMHIISKDGDDEPYNSHQYQAAMIAQRIRQMVGAETGEAEFQICDEQTDTKRDVEYGDIVILMRSLAKRAEDYVEILRLAGVPVSCQATAGYFEATEISDCPCLLKVLDNPQRDIELAAVLRSPFFKVSDSELAKIKIHSKKDGQSKGFYNCIVDYCKSGADKKLAGKLKGILEQIEKWRTIARRGDLADLIWRIYCQSGYLSFVSALPGGQVRRANLLKLHERAIQFEGFASSRTGVSLGRFVEFIEKLQEAGQDWGSAEPESAAGNAVRILSVHKSKGLEFPVVFLAETNSRFSTKDFKQDCLIDGSGALGLRIIDDKSNSKLDSIAYQIIERQRREKFLAEEMRILYVAMTRAKERLVLTASEERGKCCNIMCNGFSFREEGVPDWQLRRCQSHLEWLLYGLCDHKGLHKGFETGLAEKCEDDNLFSFKLYEQGQLEQLSKYIEGIKKSKIDKTEPVIKRSKPKRAESELLSKVKGSLAWRYRFAEAVLIPAKQSVTQLTHRGDEYVKFDYSRAFERRPKAVLVADLAQEVDRRLIGTATHLVISQLDLRRPVTKETIEETKEKLLADGAVTEAAAGCIDSGPIVKFFESKPGRTILDAENTVRREWPFTFAMPADENSSDESIVVQGIIDMLVRRPEGLLVIDFKTDNITADEAAERAELYRGQLELYGRAAEAILKTRVLGKWLYFLRPGCAVEVK